MGNVVPPAFQPVRGDWLEGFFPIARRPTACHLRFSPQRERIFGNVMPPAFQPVRAEGLGRNAASPRVFSQAVRPAGKSQEELLLHTLRYKNP